ncbi:MAG: GHKL domain-containing protein [Pleomorphochaeta sp.]
MLNSILNHYNQLIEEQNIKSTFSIKIKNYDDSLISDICIILANGIDNAIEATTKTNDKFINVDLRETENSIIISITNSFNKKNIKVINNKLITNKQDIENHGLGLKIIENLANSHSGNMIYIIKDKTFRLDIWLNNIN